MPLIQNQSIETTAQGMMRNFGDSAAQAATEIAARMGAKHPEGRELWLAVAREIQAAKVSPQL
jgi:hypothetical protein